MFKKIGLQAALLGMTAHAQDIESMLLADGKLTNYYGALGTYSRAL